jgi:hypothetical protein
MSLLAGTSVLLLSLLLAHAAVAPVLHGAAHWLYRGRPPARPDRARARAAFLLLALSPVLVATAGLSGLTHLAHDEGTWAGLLAACEHLHEHCDLLLTGASSELGIYLLLVVLVTAWTARSLWRALAPLLHLRRLPVAPVAPAGRAKLDAAVDALDRPMEVRVVDGLSGVVASIGLVRARSIVSSDVVEALAAEQLAAVLAHEAAHHRAREVWRSLAIRFAAALSPLGGRSCRAERAYGLDREILCDRAAVDRGADPLTLADALVAVSRLRASTLPTTVPAAVGHHDVDRAIRTQVELLVSDSAPASSTSRDLRPAAAAALLVAAAFALPHLAFGVVVAVHCSVESLVHLIA